MTAKRFTSMYNGQSDMIQYVDTLKEEPNKWSICNVSETLKKLNELNEQVEVCKQAYREIKEDAIKKAEENKDLEEARSYYQENFLTMKTERNQLKEENKQLQSKLEQYERIMSDFDVSCFDELRTIMEQGCGV